MDLNTRTTTIGVEDQRWLGSAHGTDSADSVKITITSTEVTNYGKTLPSGVPLDRDGTVDPDGDGNGEVHGFLLHSIDISRGAGTYSGALLWHGQVSAAGRAAKDLTALTSDQKTSLAANTQITLV